MKIIKKALCAVLLCVLLVACLFGCTKNNNTIDVPEAPELVELYQSNFISDLTKYCHSGAHFVLKENIVLTEDWVPVGQTVGTAFNGTLDGAGYTISGLKTTGWDWDGTPVTILKRTMGWKADGTPVYNSSKIIDMKTRTTYGYTEVTDIIYEGDSDDPDYIDMTENGVIEQKTSFGSIGLFGYTYGATVKNLTIDQAEFKFYGDGENVYAGIVSGYDIGSEFTDITVTNSYLLASNLYQDVISYHYQNARPSNVVPESNTKQYLGGIVGYSRGNMFVSGSTTTYKKTTFKNVHVEDVSLSNHAFSASFNAKLSAIYYDTTLEDPRDSSILITELTEEEGYGSYTIHDFVKPVRQVFVGGISGYSVGAEINDVSVKNLNKDGQLLDGNKISAGGISSSLLGGESTVKKAVVENVDFYGNNIADSAMIGGAFGEVKSAKVSDTCSVKDVVIDIDGALPGIQNACVGGFSAYCDENATVSDIVVEDVLIRSNFVSTGNLGSILGGFIGVLRDSTIGNAKVKNVTFDIENNNPELNDYCFTTNGVSQVYGNSAVTGKIETIACSYYEGTEKKEYDVVAPVVAKNNYVNEDGEISARFFYAKDGKRSDVYVTVFADLVPKMTGTSSFRMREATVWEVLTDEQKAGLNEGDSLVTGLITYYYLHFNPSTKEYHWNIIQNVNSLPDSEKVYDPAKTYALEKKMYLVEIPSSAIGTDMASDTFYTYDIVNGELTPASGKFLADTEYYVNMDAPIKEYEIDITVYTESDKTIVVQKGRTEDDDVLAKATYTVSLDKFINDPTFTDELGNVFTLCAAEVYRDIFFTEGTGFLPDINGFVITDASGASNRNFGSYVFVSGRPDIAADAITYKSTEE